MNQQGFQLLGLAMRAGKVISGEEIVITGIRKGQVKLVFLSQDASENTAKKVLDKAKTYQVSVTTVPTRDVLGRAIGKDQRVVVGVTDLGFARKLYSLCENE
ncbi:YlxQ family RNA-binding protein [Bacillus horti]|uniref:Ribosomal protein L7Ae-like RNA K-turn-binding protein n=1 Tax=Caldalkalibacillus horti TaxID=77523 RepID=A0ABT9VUP2_9BACI|nr:YlxQ family RNA-binding protein [Bacillus horti]MDQ0164707.1 ribosomal protein L7Ae-like RNA K-turn-binding protein [Bacillus horti]